MPEQDMSTEENFSGGTQDYGLHRFAGVFGMCEMEIAADRVYTAGPGASFQVSKIASDHQGLVGLCHLIRNGLVVPAPYPNCCFVAEPVFWQRCNRLLPQPTMSAGAPDA
jgi:hypothetical protein